MSKQFTINFIPYDTQRPQFIDSPVVMNNVSYNNQFPAWHLKQSTLVMARNIFVPEDSFLVQGNAPANMSIVAGMSTLTSITGVDDNAAYVPFDMDFFFFGTNYRSLGRQGGLYWNTNNVFGFGTSNGTITWTATSGIGVTLGNTDRRTNTFAVTSTIQTLSNTNFINSVLYAQNIFNDGVLSSLQWQMRLLRSPNWQYIEVRMSTVGATNGNWNITNGTTFQGTFGARAATAGAKGSSFVLRSDLNGENWTLYYSYYIDL